jgi:hypothetical protein
MMQQEQEDAERLGLNGHYFALFHDAELALMNFHIREGENTELMLRHTFITCPSANDQEPFKTMQSHERRVHPAIPAEVILHDKLEVACFRQSRHRHVSCDLCRAALPGEREQFTPASGAAVPYRRTGRN